MDRKASSESEFEVDLEMGLTDSAADSENDDDLELSFCENVKERSKVSVDQLKRDGIKTNEQVEKRDEKEKRKRGGNKNHPKPPRPPRSPSLDAFDQKLMKEISELAMLKRARVERMKALKKMKTIKSSSSSSTNIIAIVFTAIFCLVLIFHGFSCGVKPVNLVGSTISSGMTKGSLIVVPYFGNLPSPEMGSNSTS